LRIFQVKNQLENPPNKLTTLVTMNDEQQIGLQGGDDDDEMPPEMRDHMLAAFAHKAGLGPHPGMYKGPPRRKRADRDEPTDTDMQRAAEEPIAEEASAAKMHAAQTAGSTGLGPTEAQQALIKQRSALRQQAAGAAAQTAAQAQAGQSAIVPPAAPSGPAGVTQPYQAQKGPQATPGPAAGQPGPEADEEEAPPGA
jgi:hypothetical protein